MPTRKTSTKAKPRRTIAKSAVKKNEDALMEFEHFVAQKPQSNRGKSWLALTFVIIIFLLGAAWLFMSKVETMEKEYKFKAIYLDNGQTYYAKVVKEDALNVYLDEVYYIQIEQQVVPAEEEDVEPQMVDVPILIKRGQELHRPEGLMQINRSKLIAIEEIGAESQILSEINRISQ
ncbi:MAG: hypothetical protein HOC78_03955 [Candidatus Komeilibacteria bacterium]|nr:hypothetical protein [Candidatus Komeilibacteria bacterium]